MLIKCARTVCSNEGLHKHKFNGNLYCSECVYLIEENIELFGDPACFDITRNAAWVLRRDDKLHEEKGKEND